MAKKTLRAMLQEATMTIVAPCVYDCASARAVELVGFKAAMLSGGELSLAMNGVVDYGFTNLTDLEWAVSRISETSPLGLAKVRAAVDALNGTDCMLIARSNADPRTQLDEGCERLAHAAELGADMTMLVKLSNLRDATYVASKVPGWKAYPDVTGTNGVPEVTVDQIWPLGFNLMTMHYLLKAAMDGMIEHGLRNFADQGNTYSCDKLGATGLPGASATPMFDPQAYMGLEARFTSKDKVYRIVGSDISEFPASFVRTPIEDRL